MKPSQINAALRDAMGAFEAVGRALPPKPKWDATELGLAGSTRLDW